METQNSVLHFEVTSLASARSHSQREKPLPREIIKKKENLSCIAVIRTGRGSRREKQDRNTARKWRPQTSNNTKLRIVPGNRIRIGPRLGLGETGGLGREKRTRGREREGGKDEGRKGERSIVEE